MGFVVDKGQFFFSVLQFSPVSIIPLMVRTHLNLNTAVIRRTSGRSGGTFKTAMLFGKSGSVG